MAEHPAFARLDHRPWAVPTVSWIWRQQWIDLAFLHWPVAPEAIASRLPAGLELQTFDGVAWIGVVPFRMAGVMRRPFPDVPGVSAFPELNVRTYVEAGGKPGVWFLSLDAGNVLAVLGGRIWFDLPYYHARMRLTERDGWIDYHSFRLRNPAANLRVQYRPVTQPCTTRPGSFEHWLTERYCLYSHGPRRGLRRVEVHHAPWPLCACEVKIESNTFLSVHNLVPLRPDPVCHFARHLDVVVFPDERVSI